MSTLFSFYRVNVVALKTREDALYVLHDALSELKAAMLSEQGVPIKELTQAITFLRRFYERIERLILDEGHLDYRKLQQKQQQSVLLLNAIQINKTVLRRK
ncbi:hypothetical protein HUZ36_14450 [Pseudoalteromonas sp. McH1-7]|uniref:Uncharacterized protein n=1 Tax=Pseudoalteromonas peptidolytica F12-50-A1 TaxID=1315280 RepID=A0A8I0MXK6_9GAMM|nr:MULTISPECIES: hypothetical protein [Pseudoalteromonas]MBE0347829.1 hypothetical protein [Pseudoalteromonas peptidolytica F12-50-A1]MDW7551264.1 hypothetical protein [Pseudoalteromonas peptidolytica]NLR15263.1 hypothetical protein [Pseudoalteromonas peptidolytica]NUZ11986.1 hypothetical protein [Pseudoalteromonas sp. McH1-7]RRS09175.1 hypothetical protein EAG18_08625 [Pseudoalteromonas sp. J010]